MTQPAFWKLSMGKNDFTDVLEVLDWLRQGLVVAHSQTKKKASETESQGEQFVDSNRDSDYFYLCHGNRKTTHPRRGIILFGRFSGPAKTVRHHRWTNDGWAGREFDWIKTAVTPKKFSGEHKQWTPRNNSTFVRVPDTDLEQFQAEILKPYFELTLSKLGVNRIPSANASRTKR